MLTGPTIIILLATKNWDWVHTVRSLPIILSMIQLPDCVRNVCYLFNRCRPLHLKFQWHSRNWFCWMFRKFWGSKTVGEPHETSPSTLINSVPPFLHSQGPLYTTHVILYSSLFFYSPPPLQDVFVSITALTKYKYVLCKSAILKCLLIQHNIKITGHKTHSTKMMLQERHERHGSYQSQRSPGVGVRSVGVSSTASSSNYVMSQSTAGRRTALAQSYYEDAKRSESLVSRS